MRIYVAGPYTKGDVAVNVRNAILAADRILELGHVPFLPHLTHFWHLISPKEYETWMKLDFDWLWQCDALLRLPGESSGADREVQEAKRLNLMVFYGIAELEEYVEVAKVIATRMKYS